MLNPEIVPSMLTEFKQVEFVNEAEPERILPSAVRFSTSPTEAPAEGCNDPTKAPEGVAVFVPVHVPVSLLKQPPVYVPLAIVPSLEPVPVRSLVWVPSVRVAVTFFFEIDPLSIPVVAHAN